MAQCSGCGRQLDGPSLGMENRICSGCQETASPVTAQPQPILPESSLHRVPSITIGLMAINVAVFVVMGIAGGSWLRPTSEQLIRSGANYGPLSLSHQPWRLLTSLFVHFGWIHFLLDTLYLFLTGRIAERLYGKNTFLLLYLTCGIAGGLLALFLKPDLVSAGASGAIFGIAGCLAPASWPTNHNRPNPELRMTWVLVWCGMSALNLSIFDIEGTASLTIPGGIIAGVILGLCLRPKSGKAEPSRSLVFLIALVVLFGGTLGVRRAAAQVLRRERGVSAYRAGNYEPAIRELEAVVRAKPTDSYAQAVLGEAYLHTYEYDKAEAPLKQALAISPQYDYARKALAYEQSVTRGIDSYDSDQYPAAISDLQEAANARPDDAYVQYLLGSAYLQSDDYDDAEPPLQRALALSPGYTDAEEGLAYIYTVTDRDQDGLKEYADVVRQDPDSESARLGMGTALNNLERYDEAIAVFQEAVRRHPDSPDAHYSLGFAFLDSKQCDLAVSSLREALRLQPKYPEARKELADALRCRGKARSTQPK